MTEYPLADAARIFHLSPARLRYWERTALVRASATHGSQPAFAFRDLVCIRAVITLLDHGVPVRRIRRSVERLRERIPEIDRPLDALRVWVEGSNRIVVRWDGALMEPEGQLVLDFQVGAELEGEEADEVAALRLESEQGGFDPHVALEHFERGCQLDSDPSSFAAAVEAYRAAVEIDPGFADAHCNLGTVLYHAGERDEARASYLRAIEADPEHVEANFNLANMLEEDGRNEAALRHYKSAMRADPLYADVHLNLALLYEKLGLPNRGKQHWRRYVGLAPAGNWAEVARQRLERIEPED